MKFFFLIIFLFLSKSWAQNPPDPTFISTAQIQGFTITSDNLSRDMEKGTVLLQGNVKVIYQTQYFEADEIEINTKLKRAHLVGNVKVQAATFQMTGKEVMLDYESNQGLIYFGSVQSNNVRFQGDMIEKLSDTEFFVSHADYTTCSNCPATWSFEGSKIRAELGGYAYLKNSFLRVGGVPIFWFPYLVVPLKSVRQSGLLTPEIGYINNRKLVISQSGFWAISRSQDATFTIKSYEIGGVKPLVEYRYIQDENSFGQINTSFFRDSLTASDIRYNRYRQAGEQGTPYNRWALRSYQQYQPNQKNKLQLQLSLASDLQYPKDFNDEFKNYADSALENRATYSYLMDHSLFTIDGSYYKNLLHADPLANNSSAVHRLPEIRFDSTYTRVFELPVYYRVEASYNRFYRNKAYDDISVWDNTDPLTGKRTVQRYVTNTNSSARCEHDASPDCRIIEDGNYDPNNDIIRTGQRYLLRTSLTTNTYNLADFVNLAPTLSYNEAQYIFDVGDNRYNSRRYLQFDLNTRTKFHDIYDSNYIMSGRKFKNEIIPEIQYSWIPWIQQDSHPFFGTNSVEAPYSSKSIVSDQDANTKGGVLFDYRDRVYDRHIITFSLLDRLVRKKREDNSYKTLVNFRLSQSYDLYQAQQEENKGQPLSDLSGTLLLDLDQVKSYSQVNYFPYLSATNSTTSISYLNEHQQYFKVGFSSKRTEEPRQDDVSFAIGFVSTYVNVLTGVIFDTSADRNNSSRLKKYSLITQFKPPGECWAVNFFRNQKVGSEAEWKFTFDFSFDGKPTKVIPPEELNIN
ncbi:MAG: LPS assembly protein LptD [Bdellovibrio sp.]|nr:LPS assembly protein LptD [Bdellovibrio sp.]